MRLQLFTALSVAVLGASSATAGRLFGDVKLADKPVAAGVLITIQPVPKAEAGEKAATTPPDSAITDKLGSYKIMIKNEGKCTLTVHLEKQTAALEVFSYKEPTRYDLILEEKDGKLTVRRK